MPKLSIIIPVYNAELYLRECLDSIKNQTFTDFEVLMINDGSSDSSGAICDEYAEADMRFKAFHKENGGVSSARNLGLDNAKGEWISFLDSDDYLLSNEAYKEIFDQAENGDYDLINFGYKGDKEEGNLAKRIKKEKLDKENILKNFLIFFNVWSSFYKREKIKDLRFSEIKIGEDTLFIQTFLLNKAVNSILLLDKAYIYYRDNLSSAMNTFQPSTLQDRVEIISSIRKQIELNKLDVDKFYLDNHIIFYYIHALKTYSRFKNSDEIVELMEKYSPKFDIPKIISWKMIFENIKPNLTYLLIKLKLYKLATLYIKQKIDK